MLFLLLSMSIAFCQWQCMCVSVCVQEALKYVGTPADTKHSSLNFFPPNVLCSCICEPRTNLPIVSLSFGFPQTLPLLPPLCSFAIVPEPCKVSENPFILALQNPIAPYHGHLSIVSQGSNPESAITFFLSSHSTSPKLHSAHLCFTGIQHA